MTSRISAFRAFIAISFLTIVQSRTEAQSDREFTHVADAAEIRQARGLGDADNSKLTIVGTITLHKTGSNQSVGITLELFRPTTAGIFSFTLSGTTHIESKISGVIVESER